MLIIVGAENSYLVGTSSLFVTGRLSFRKLQQQMQESKLHQGRAFCKTAVPEGSEKGRVRGLGQQVQASGSVHVPFCLLQ